MELPEWEWPERPTGHRHPNRRWWAQVSCAHRATTAAHILPWPSSRSSCPRRTACPAHPSRRRIRSPRTRHRCRSARSRSLRAVCRRFCSVRPVRKFSKRFPVKSPTVTTGPRSLASTSTGSSKRLSRNVRRTLRFATSSSAIPTHSMQRSPRLATSTWLPPRRVIEVSLRPAWTVARRLARGLRRAPASPCDHGPTLPPAPPTGYSSSASLTHVPKKVPCTVHSTLSPKASQLSPGSLPSLQPVATVRV